MNVNGKHYRTIWIKPGDEKTIQVIDQRSLPHTFQIEEISSVDQICIAIKDMHIRGAGLIGAAAGYGMYLASLEASSNQSFDAQLKAAGQKIITTRPTAVNLKWAVDRQLNAIKKGKSTQEKIEIAKQTAQKIANEDVEYCRKIGALGLRLIQDILSQKKD